MFVMLTKSSEPGEADSAGSLLSWHLAATWKYIAPIQRSAWRSKAFGYQTWGGEIAPSSNLAQAMSWPPSIGVPVVSPTRIWICSSRNTAFTSCVEATVRFAAELGYEITMVKATSADYSDKEIHAALEVNIPNYASAIVTTDEIVAAISFSCRRRSRCPILM
jgi:hypothetical protein